MRRCFLFHLHFNGRPSSAASFLTVDDGLGFSGDVKMILIFDVYFDVVFPFQITFDAFRPHAMDVEVQAEFSTALRVTGVFALIEATTKGVVRFFFTQHFLFKIAVLICEFGVRIWGRTKLTS